MKVLAAKGETAEWILIEQVYTIIKQLEDGCNTNDITSLMNPPVTQDRVSSAVSKLVLAFEAPVSSERKGKGEHIGLKIVRPLPEVLYDDPNRARRAVRGDGINLAGMSRVDLLKLKMQINVLLAGMPK